MKHLTVFKIYVLVAVITFGHAMSALNGRTYETFKDREKAQFVAIISAPAWPLYLSYKAFSWARTIEVVVK